MSPVTCRRESRPPRRAPPRPPANALAAALDRQDAVIEDETLALETEAAINLAEVNRQKSQSLLEITRLARSLAPGEGGPLQARIATVRDRLFTNHRLLGFHLTAVREVSDLMLGILSEADSDGTYDQGYGRREKRP
jgi:hypothetical protein